MTKRIGTIIISLFVVIFVLFLAAPATYAFFDNVEVEQEVEVDVRNTNLNTNINSNKNENNNSNRNINSNKNTNLNTNLNNNKNSNDGNRQTINIEDKRQFGNTVGPYQGPGLTTFRGDTHFSNNVWLYPGKVSNADAVAMQPSLYHRLRIRETIETTVEKVEKEDRSVAIIELGYNFGQFKPTERDMVGIIQLRGTKRTKGWQLELYALKLAMKYGATGYEVINRGVGDASIFSASLGLGSSGQLTALKGDASQVAGSGGSGTTIGTTMMKKRVFYAIAIYK